MPSRDEIWEEEKDEILRRQREYEEEKKTRENYEQYKEWLE